MLGSVVFIYSVDIRNISGGFIYAGKLLRGVEQTVTLKVDQPLMKMVFGEGVMKLKIEKDIPKTSS